MLSDYKYLAFITYAHKDEERARWLRKKLEGFRVPPNLIGSNGLYGPIPTRLYPIFRDRDELVGSAQLGPLIEKALEESSHLIVLCSPNAVNSRWVNEEIRLFKKWEKPIGSFAWSWKESPWLKIPMGILRMNVFHLLRGERLTRKAILRNESSNLEPPI